jgi:hypothetical protein
MNGGMFALPSCGLHNDNPFSSAFFASSMLSFARYASDKTRIARPCIVGGAITL